MTFSDDWLCSL